MDLAELDEIFRLLGSDYAIVYIRHGMAAPTGGYSQDNVQPLDLHEATVLADHPHVFNFDDLYRAHVEAGGPMTLNLFKNALYARCFHFLSAQGGGAHHVSLFKGALLAILHLDGMEERIAYGRGYYGFAANPAPVRAIAYSRDEFRQSFALFQGPGAIRDRALIAPDKAPLLERLSPWRKGPGRPAPWERNAKPPATA